MSTTTTITRLTIIIIATMTMLTGCLGPVTQPLLQTQSINDATKSIESALAYYHQQALVQIDSQQQNVINTFVANVKHNIVNGPAIEAQTNTFTMQLDQFKNYRQSERHQCSWPSPRCPGG